MPGAMPRTLVASSGRLGFGVVLGPCSVKDSLSPHAKWDVTSGFMMALVNAYMVPENVLSVCILGALLGIRDMKTMLGWVGSGWAEAKIVRNSVTAGVEAGGGRGGGGGNLGDTSGPLEAPAPRQP